MPLAFAIRRQWRQWRKAPLAGCVVIISDLDGNIILVRHSYGGQGWALPGGGMTFGEDPQLAARREILEELGMELGTMRLVARVEETLSHSPHTVHLFEAKSEDFPRADRREVLEARYFPRHSLPEPQTAHTRKWLDLWREDMKTSG